MHEYAHMACAHMLPPFFCHAISRARSPARPHAARPLAHSPPTGSPHMTHAGPRHAPARIMRLIQQLRARTCTHNTQLLWSES